MGRRPRSDVPHADPCPVHPWHLRRAAAVLRGGGVLAYPAEGVYGLGCNPLNPAAVQRLLALKSRSPDKGLILIAADFAQLRPFLLPLRGALRTRVHTEWPGPVTWLLPAQPWVPELLRGAHECLAVRVTAHPVAAALCTAAGFPLVSTSANPTGRPPARNALAVRRWFGRDIDYLVHGYADERRRPTEIRDARTGRILRPG